MLLMKDRSLLYELRTYLIYVKVGGNGPSSVNAKRYCPFFFQIICSEALIYLIRFSDNYS